MAPVAFAAFRGAYPFWAEFWAPAKGWGKGSVEGGVKYVRNLVFRPRLAVDRWAVRRHEDPLRVGRFGP